MPVTPDNPIGLDGFEFVEFTSPQPDKMAALIEQLGFVAFSKHPALPIVRYKQGGINILVNSRPDGQAAEFRAAHGPSAADG
ncbi:MAG: 4-hydroxyphenylpyruvate dioxygenase, partial [Caulobacteraceae bacterium]